MRQSVAQISAELSIHVVTLYNWRKPWRLQGEVVPASEKEPEGWSTADKLTVVIESAGLNATELGAYCRERGLFQEQVQRWRQAAQDAYEKPVLSLRELKKLEKLCPQDAPLPAKLTPLHFDQQGGLMEQSNATLQRGRQG